MQQFNMQQNSQLCWNVSKHDRSHPDYKKKHQIDAGKIYKLIH